MTVDRETYVAMNKAYNTLFDNWKKIPDMDRRTEQAMNTAMVLLDQVLDVIKADAPAPQQNGAKPAKPAVEIPEGWSVI